MHLPGMGDDELVSLYRAAAFCVYPSRYEGLGLPIIEAFLHGKAVIASTGGALPETVDGLSPCLDPTHEDAWFETLKRWIEDPSLRSQHEARIRANFSHPTWEEAASRIFATVRDKKHC
jgi:glycosyltransferase involved in cell wall biosynthesis